MLWRSQRLQEDDLRQPDCRNSVHNIVSNVYFVILVLLQTFGRSEIWLKKLLLLHVRGHCGKRHPCSTKDKEKPTILLSPVYIFRISFCCFKPIWQCFEYNSTYMDHIPVYSCDGCRYFIFKNIANRVAIIHSLASTKFRAGQSGALIQIEVQMFMETWDL